MFIQAKRALAPNFLSIPGEAVILKFNSYHDPESFFKRLKLIFGDQYKALGIDRTTDKLLEPSVNGFLPQIILVPNTVQRNLCIEMDTEYLATEQTPPIDADIPIDVNLCNVILIGLFKNKQEKAAIDFFLSLSSRGVIPNMITFCIMIDWCTKIGN